MVAKRDVVALDAGSQVGRALEAGLAREDDAAAGIAHDTLDAWQVCAVYAAVVGASAALLEVRVGVDALLVVLSQPLHCRQETRRGTDLVVLRMLAGGNKASGEASLAFAKELCHAGAGPDDKALLLLPRRLRGSSEGHGLACAVCLADVCSRTKRSL